MYKPLSDSTLMNMTKKEIIEHLRIAEHNHRVCEETIDQQYKNCMKLLKEERINAIEELVLAIDQNLSYDICDGREAMDEIVLIAEKLKEKSNE